MLRTVIATIFLTWTGLAACPATEPVEADGEPEKQTGRGGSGGGGGY